MSDVVLSSLAEQRAQAATRFAGFGVSLIDVKRNVAELLSQIGRHGFFAEYSKHDISHINEVLSIAEWLIDDDTKERMTDADWFLLTLSIYFHDLGMLVTKEEFSNRNQSSFAEFCNDILFTGPRAPEYRSRIEEMPSDDREVFLYQEFVRFNHAKRVRQWIDGSLHIDLGAATAAAGEVHRLLLNLDPTLRRDLGLIAESHHLDDLDDLNKYKLVQPYGPSDAETANLQYCAIILRTADLLHMRRDRTPSVLFRLINPTDPISQREWAKQNAVRRVMPRTGLNEDGVPDEKAKKDNIEIHASFNEENGFFGLTSFLGYVAKELKKCHDWIDFSQKSRGSKYGFPWKRVAEDQIETEGFLRKTYSFDLDQYKILDLLIGHTLYNDTGVVLRELSQNGLDAIRLQQSESSVKSGLKDGMLKVTWDSVSRILTISDNGTGMTQEVIENHLLKVGSSRYQEQKFKEQHPEFSAISRFGIGVLSTFMVSDEVEITTCSLEEEKARKISLRSVHGRYLVRLLDKVRDPEAAALAPHGTKIQLKVRSTAKFGDVARTMRQWIIIPRCTVTISVDGAPPINIGYKSTADAVESYLADVGLSTSTEPPEYKVITKVADGVEFSYAARWSSYYKDWTIFNGASRGQQHPIPCTCVEGIAVVFTTPAMNSRSLVAIANATGSNAPKTNVARSTLEDTPERNQLYSAIYGLYVNHVKDEITRLTEAENYSLTWAANNAITLVPFGLSFAGGGDAVLPTELREHMKSLPIYIVEKDGRRKNISFRDLSGEDTFWTVNSQLVQAAEELVREAKSNSTVGSLVKALGDNAQEMPSETILYNLDVSQALRESIELEFEPFQIIASETLRRVSIKWTSRTSTNWIKVDDSVKNLIDSQSNQRYAQITNYVEQRLRQFHDGRRRISSVKNARNIWLANDLVSFAGLDRYAGISAHYQTFLRGNSALTQFLRELAAASDEENVAARLQIFGTIYLSSAEMSNDEAVSFAAIQLRQVSDDWGETLISGKDRFLEALGKSPLEIFDTSVWKNRRYDFGGGPYSH